MFSFALFVRLKIHSRNNFEKCLEMMQIKLVKPELLLSYYSSILKCLKNKDFTVFSQIPKARLSQDFSYPMIAEIHYPKVWKQNLFSRCVLEARRNSLSAFMHHFGRMQCVDTANYCSACFRMISDTFKHWLVQTKKSNKCEYRVMLDAQSLI